MHLVLSISALEAEVVSALSLCRNRRNIWWWGKVGRGPAAHVLSHLVIQGFFALWLCHSFRAAQTQYAAVVVDCRSSFHLVNHAHVVPKTQHVRSYCRFGIVKVAAPGLLISARLRDQRERQLPLQMQHLYHHFKTSFSQHCFNRLTSESWFRRRAFNCLYNNTSCKMSCLSCPSSVF